jgi:carboxyl-terminal processing protease
MMSFECRRPVALLLASLLACGGAGLAEAQGTRSRPETRSADTVADRLQVMLRALRIARDWHIEGPAKPELIAGAIEGLLARLDAEAEFYAREDLRRIARFAPTARAGLGLEVGREPAQRRLDRKGYRVIAARDGSPAAGAGLKPGDLITHVDGKTAGDIPYLAFTKAVLDGRPGSRVRLTVERSGEDGGAEDVVLVRAELRGTEVAIDEVVPGILRIRVPWLGADAARALAAKWAAYEAGWDHSRLLRGVILDLRNTAAETPDAVRAVADAFLETGAVLRTVARRPADDRNEKATPGDLAGGRAMIVLVDGGTAGGTEMLVAALQDGRRARVVGTKTAGRGAVRTLVALDQRGRKGLLRMTTERLVTPGGLLIDDHGVVPDVVIEQLPAATGCRVLDIADADAPGRCVPRTLAQDTQLQRAISLLDEPLIAAEETSATAKP